MFIFNHLNSAFFFHFAIHLVSIFILFQFIHFPRFRDRGSAFGFFMISIVIFATTYFLKDINVSLGFTFGLFAVFSNLRYRTEPISTEKMTYLFIAISLSMINAVSGLNYFELSIINPLMLAISFVVQFYLFASNQRMKRIKYERIELITPDRNRELIDDLRQRTGLEINRVEVGNIDFVRDVANLKVFYKDVENQYDDYDWGE